MKKVIIIVIVLIGGGLFWLHSYLGGFDELEFTQIDTTIWLNGQSFKGSYNDVEIEGFFVRAREIAQKNDDYNLAILSYPMEKTTVDQVVGVVAKSPMSELDENFDVSKKIEGSFLSTTIAAHNLVMPKPDEVMTAAKEYAQKQGYEIDSSYSLEVYEAERRLVVYFPLR